MPQKPIKLHVSANNNEGGVLKVHVTPWRVHLDAGDVVTWELDAHGPAKNDIEWFRIEQIDRAKKWPFDVEPPDPSYTGINSTTGSGIVTSPPKKPAAMDVISYGLTIGFRDDANNLRIMYIDPDMVIDS